MSFVLQAGLACTGSGADRFQNYLADRIWNRRFFCDLDLTFRLDLQLTLMFCDLIRSDIFVVRESEVGSFKLEICPCGSLFLSLDLSRS